MGARAIGDERARRTGEERVGEGSSTRAKKTGEKGGNCATIINISQSKKGLMVRNQENRGGAENVRYGSTEVSKSPYPLPTIQC